MPLAADLADLLGTIDQPASFVVSGTIGLPAPGLAVEGVGPVALPLPPVQAADLIAAAEPAP